MAAVAGPALPLVHGLHPRHRDGASLFEEVRTQALRFRHLFGPWISVGQQIEGRVHGEVARRDVVEIVPADRERHRHSMAYFQYIDAWRSSGDYEGLEFR